MARRNVEWAQTAIQQRSVCATESMTIDGLVAGLYGDRWSATDELDDANDKLKVIHARRHVLA